MVLEIVEDGLRGIGGEERRRVIGRHREGKNDRREEGG